MSQAQAWALIAGCAAVTAIIKAAGPVTVGGRGLPGWSARIVAFMAPALLAALIVTQALADGRDLHVGADTAGVAVAGVLLWRGASIVTGVIAAAAVTAALRGL